MDEQTIYTPTYSHLLVRFQGREHHLVWYTFFEGPSKDGVIVDNDAILVFHAFDTLQGYASQHNIAIADAAEDTIDLDAISDWLAKPEPQSVDCVSFLEAWNLFTDVAHSLSMPFRDRDPKANKIYDKLFWGNNLPAVTPEGEHYEPTWTPSDIARMSQVMRRGLDIFQARVRHHPVE